MLSFAQRWEPLTPGDISDLRKATVAVDAALQAIGSPAPAPVAPPLPPDYVVQRRFMGAFLPDTAESLRVPAPPAVAGGDAPEIQVGDVIIEATFPNDGIRVTDEDQAQSCNLYASKMLAIYREPLWRRRQEGQ